MLFCIKVYSVLEHLILTYYSGILLLPVSPYSTELFHITLVYITLVVAYSNNWKYVYDSTGIDTIPIVIYNITKQVEPLLILSFDPVLFIF